jgi:hypothetical protein
MALWLSPKCLQQVTGVAQRIRQTGLWATLLLGEALVEPNAALVESIVHASGCAVMEDENLRQYRIRVLLIGREH